LYCAGHAASCSTNNGNVMYAGIVTPSLNLLQSFGCDKVNRLAGSSQGTSWTRNHGYDQYGNGWVTANSGVPLSPSTPPCCASSRAAHPSPTALPPSSSAPNPPAGAFPPPIPAEL
jgi:hypothetical protein